MDEIRIDPHPEPLVRYLNPLSLLTGVWRRRGLIRHFTKREVEQRYRRSFLGLLWSFLNPIVLLAAYTIVFGIVLEVRWPRARTHSSIEFGVILFCGLIAFNMVSECVGAAANVVTNNPTFVKKTVFPLEILPVVLLGSAAFHWLVGLLVLLPAHLLSGGSLSWTIGLAPIVVFPLFLITLGVSWFVAALGVAARDVGATVGLILQILLFLTPIFYSAETVPAALRTWLAWNPLSTTIDGLRRVLLWGEMPAWSDLGVQTILSSVICQVGYAFFMRRRKYFADLI